MATAQPSTIIPGEYIEAISGLDLAGYSVEGVLGRGGVGVVFAATHEGDPVAVKLAWPWPSRDEGFHPERTRYRLRQPRLSDDQRALKCIAPIDLPVCNRAVKGEAVRLGEISHGAVVKLVSRFAVDGRAAYATERFDGEALPLKPGPALTKLARAIQALHDRDWPHGDLKPDNARVNDQGELKLIDPLPIGSELLTPAWNHLNFLVSTPLVDSADPRDRRMVFRHRDLVALALMACQAFTGERPWSHPEVAGMLDRSVPTELKRQTLHTARERVDKLIPKLPEVLRPFVALALDPGLWPDEGPIFAAYLQARPFEVRCDALATLDVGELFAKACG